jgi:hypothetical protein
MLGPSASNLLDVCGVVVTMMATAFWKMKGVLLV